MKSIFLIITVAAFILAVHLYKNYYETRKQQAFLLQSIIEIFLNIFEQEDYNVLTNQPLIFANYEKLLAILYKTSTDNLEDNVALSLAKALYKGANIYRCIATTKSLELARKYHQKTLKIKEQKLQPQDLELAHSLSDLGATYNELKGADNNRIAINYYNQALAIYENNEQTENYTASTLHKLGNAYRDLDEKNVEIAIDYLNRSLKIFETLPDTEYNRCEKGKVFYNQGVNYHHLNSKTDSKKALEYLIKAESQFKQNKDMIRYSLTISYLGEVYRSLGHENILLALNYLNEAKNIQGILLGNESPHLAKTFYYLAITHHDLGSNEDLKKAIKYGENALEIQKKYLREDHPDIIKTKKFIDYHQRHVE